MFAYVVRRLGATVVVMTVVAFVVFSLLYFTPGDPAAILAGDAATDDDIRRIRAKLGLDEPFFVRFGAKEELAAAIASTKFMTPICPVYQNVNALPSTDVEVIKKNLMDQLTAPVRWTQLVQNMVNDGGTSFIECGPGKVLQGLVKKIAPQVEASSL